MDGSERAGGEGRLREAARRWAIALTGQESVTGTPGEAAFAPWLAAELERSADFGGRRRVWTFPVLPGDARRCVAMLLRGRGRRTVILTGHFDTVSVEDYGPLRALATQPEALAAALGASLDGRTDPAAERAKADLAGGDFLPGRGLLDMKAGLAAGLAAAADFAGQADAEGNLLFLAVPDEENNSAGARSAARLLPEIAREHGLELAAAINLDAIADDGEGVAGRVAALGTVGKVLPTALVIGTPTHSGFPFNGVNAAALAAAIAARVEWAPELTEARPEGGTAPSLLSLRDGKTGYDVTTPASAFATFNVLSYRRAPAEVLEAFDRLCAESAVALLGQLRERAAPSAPSGLPAEIPVHRYEAVAAAAAARDPANAAKLEERGAALAGSDLSLPEKCRLITEQAWALSGWAGPAVVTGFGSIPYLPTNLSETPAAARLEAAVARIAGESAARYGTPVTCVDYFAGISDMSFLGEADEGTLDVVARNTPMWRHAVRWPERGGIANVPTVNIGPWGRDYHTPLERLHAPYAFGVLPRLLVDILGALLAGAGQDGAGTEAGEGGRGR